jgi:UPF0271 protein
MDTLKIDLNCDLGESYGRFKIGQDTMIMPWITSCNIACGFHGGDPLTIQKTIDLALENNVQIGAHPSYPDLLGFGRRQMNLQYNDLKSLMMYQISAIKGMVEAAGGRLKHVKPHGALYNVMAVDRNVALCIIDAIGQIDPLLVLVGPAGRDWYHIAQTHKCLAVKEIFSDRNYKSDLTLVPRTEKYAMIDAVRLRVEHVKRMVIDQKVKTNNGSFVLIQGDTVCIHGDHPSAVETAKQLHSGLTDHGIIIQSYA